MKRSVCVTLVVVVVLLVVAAVAVLTALLLVVGGQPARVNTTCGMVEGQFHPEHKAFSFKGLPYAEPPVGAGRWRRPRPRQTPCWTGVYQANSNPRACAQYEPISRKFSGQEDCLYLNVFTPSVDPPSPLPVMVYIHGGYLQWSNGSVPGISPDPRVTGKLNVVFVSVQYRLGTLGYLVSSALPGGKGNYGIWDQVEALKWVRDNIRGFGGDPTQVTVFGSSSGGTSVWVHAMTPHARGLFNRAWIISGSPVLNKTLSDAVTENDDWLLKKQVLKEKCNGGTVTEECLRNLNVEVVSALVYPEWNITDDSNDLPLKGYFEPPLLVVDGDLIPDAPFDMWRNHQGNYSDVPMIIGTVAQEIDLSPAPGNALLSWSEEELRTYVAHRLDPFGNDITNQSLIMYKAGHVGYDPQLVFTTMTSDLRMTCGNDVMAGLAATGLNSDVYRYVVTSFPSQPVHAFGSDYPSKYAFHAWDVFAFFDGIDYLIPDPASSDTEFASLLQENILHFVRTGKPLDSNWKTYPNATALIGERSQVVAAYHKDECDFWLSNNFFGYSWIN